MSLPLIRGARKRPRGTVFLTPNPKPFMKLSDNGENKKSSANAGNPHTPELPNKEPGLTPCPFCGCSLTFRRYMQAVHPDNDCILGNQWFTDSEAETEQDHIWNKRAPLISVGATQPQKSGFQGKEIK